MTYKEAIQILKDHNNWRRDNNIPALTQQTEPKLLGQAIDIVVKQSENGVLDGVSQQRKLLESFTDFVNSRQFNKYTVSKDEVDEFLDSNCD